RAEAILTPKGSGWHLNTTPWLRRRAAFTLPETTYDLVAWRIAPLAPDALYLLEVLAVAGQPLPFALLRAFPAVPTERFVQPLDALLIRRLLVEAPGDTLALPHHLLRETLLARLSHLRRRTIHRELLQVLERYPTSQASVPLRQLALHAVAGEDGD